METITITTEYIRLQDLMKLANMVSSGGEAKQLIQDGQVLVNGDPASSGEGSSVPATQ